MKPDNGGEGWWRGDYGGKKQHYFPANYVTEIDRIEEGDEGVTTGRSLKSGKFYFNISFRRQGNHFYRVT